VLFIDAIGSTPYTERADPEQVRAKQSVFFATVRRIVRQYGGVVEKYIGDAAMALFGAPVATGADAVRCVRAGLDLQRALAREESSDEWIFRVGIATGDALVDVAAAYDGGQAIVAGDVVNTAARLQSEAPAAGVLVDSATYEASRAEIRYAAQAPLTLRGRTGLTEVWLAQSPIQRQTVEESDDLPMVGRDHELSLLTSALEHVIAERTPRLVTVTGPAGIGKSRLVRELYQHATRLETPLSWHSGRCPPFGENVAYAALADVVRDQVGALATDSPDTIRERLDAALSDLVPAGESARLSDALRPLLGLPGSPLSTEDAESAWRRFLLTLAGQGPTVVVFEDLHWADDRMLRFVEFIGATVRDVPLLVVCTARPDLMDRDPGWAGSVSGRLTISLTPLRDDSIATLYGQMFGAATLPPELLAPLVGLADGMPLYAQEYGRMLVDQGTLRQSDDQTWVIESTDALPMPDSVHAVIANRIDLLDVTERAVLQAAAVVGPRFWPGAVAAALGTGVDMVEPALRTLVQRDLVREQPASSMADEPEFRFRHVLVNDVCYERLPRSERVARHVRTADWLDAHLDGRGRELAEVVAHHRFVAFETARAIGQDPRPFAGPALAALRQAAQRAAMLNAYDAAATHVARANDLIGARPDLGGESDRLAVELLGIELALNQDSDSFVTGPGPERLTELATLLYRVNDHGGAARAWTLLGQLAWLRADRAEALRCLDRAVELFDSWPDTPEKAQTYAELGRLHMLNYEHAPAMGATQIAADIAARLGLVELRANALITLGMCRYQAGERDGLADLQEALEFCRQHRLPSLRRAVQNVALALREEGDRARSDSLIGAAPPEPPGETLMTVQSVDALQAMFAGDWDAFFAVADEVLAHSSGERDLQLRGVRSWMRALRGDPAGATEDATATLSTARSTGFWRLKWSALAHSALTQALLENRADSEALLQELEEGWRRMRTIASGDWVAAAAHAATRLGPDAAHLLRDALADAPHHTAWSRAALASVDGTLAASRGDYRAAATFHLDAAERYAAVGSETDRAFAVSAAADALNAAGDPRAAEIQREAAAFALRNHIDPPR
jgi:predicted ATPase/class 3 adenylate cyclase